MNHRPYRSVAVWPQRAGALLAAVLLVVSASATGDAAATDAGALRQKVDRLFDGDAPALLALYEDLHSHPELAYQEVRTAGVLAEQMRALGFEVTEHVGKTGVVARLRNGPGPTVLVRTELDALPMEEKTGLRYASHAVQSWHGRESPVTHSCGHDIHMAAWVGTARALVALRDRWHGTLLFVAQPAEEGQAGARAMLADGFIERFGRPDAGFALHVGPEAYGTVSYRAGPISSNSDSFELRLDGKGGHGSMPSTTIDPVVMAGHFIVDLQSVISREKDPAAFGVISIGAVEGGSAPNIIPDHVTLRGTIRSYAEPVRQGLLDGLARTANAVAAMAKAPAPVLTITPGYHSVVNDAALTARTARRFRGAFGDRAIELDAPGTASEDYSEFILAGVPSVYFGIGGYDPAVVAQARASGQSLPMNHSPQFAPVPAPTIRTGVEAMTVAVLGVLGR